MIVWICFKQIKLSRRETSVHTLLGGGGQGDGKGEEGGEKETEKGEGARAKG